MDKPISAMNISDILNTLPHRYPFVLVDRIIDVTAGESITSLKNVSMNEPYFQGHFPSEPVMPGVLILEGLAQTGALMAYLTMQDQIGKKLVYFAGLDGVRFRKKVVPGDQLIMKVHTVKKKMRIWTLAGKAFVDDKLVAEAQLMATFS
jgi:3-hydroxyacyl-[acyl-carrier-protein] dehydratase